MSPMASRAQSGVTLVLAVFIIVVVSGTVLLLMQWLTIGSQTSSNTLLRARALAAAQSGLDYAIYTIQQSNACVNTTLNLTDGSLTGFSVTISCLAYTPINEAGTNHTWYVLTARASMGSVGQPGMVSRQVGSELWI